ncbi:MAG: hypothetical protein ABSE69_12425, partial [Roseiarcus sp.]
MMRARSRGFGDAGKFVRRERENPLYRGWLPSASFKSRYSPAIELGGDLGVGPSSRLKFPNDRRELFRLPICAKASRAEDFLFAGRSKLARTAAKNLTDR